MIMTIAGVAMEDTSNARNKALATLASQGALLRRNLRKPVSIESRRIALERMITLEFPHFKGFFAEFSSNISMTGMFIKTDRIQALGTLVAFEFSLADGLSLIRGEAEVVWARRRHEGPDRPSGMGLRFVRLDKESRRLIRWAVEKQLQDGGRSFDLDDQPAKSANLDDPLAKSADLDDQPAERRSTEFATGDTENDSVADINLLQRKSDGELESRLRSYAGVGVAQAEGGSGRWVRYGAVVGLLIVGVLVLAFQWHASDGSKPGARGSEATGDIQVPAGAEVAPNEAVSAEAASTEAVSAEAVSAETMLQAKRVEVFDMVASWAGAWSAQRVDNYLSFYAESYRPEDNMSFDGWRALRRKRILSPRRIEVGITDLEVQVRDAEHARASFLQSYASDSFSDQTRKFLELVLEDGQWKILEERAEA